MITNIGGIMRDLEAEKIAYERRTSALRWAGQYHARAEIARIMARFELEPDEFYTAEEKALRILGRKVSK